MQSGLRCGKLDGTQEEVTEYRSILIKVTLCREGGEGFMETVAWKRAESGSTVNCSTSTEYSWLSVCGSSVASKPRIS